MRGVLARLLPSTLRSALRLRPGRSGIFSLDSRRLLLCGIGSKSAALRRLLLRRVLLVPKESLWQTFMDGLNGFTSDIFEGGRDQGVQEERESL